MAPTPEKEKEASEGKSTALGADTSRIATRETSKRTQKNPRKEGTHDGSLAVSPIKEGHERDDGETTHVSASQKKGRWSNGKKRAGPERKRSIGKGKKKGKWGGDGGLRNIVVSWLNWERDDGGRKQEKKKRNGQGKRPAFSNW